MDLKIIIGTCSNCDGPVVSELAEKDLSTENIYCAYCEGQPVEVYGSVIQIEPLSAEGSDGD